MQLDDGQPARRAASGTPTRLCPRCASLVGAADVVTLVSRREGLPRSLMEALCAGRAGRGRPREGQCGRRPGGAGVQSLPTSRRRPLRRLLMAALEDPRSPREIREHFLESWEEGLESPCPHTWPISSSALLATGQGGSDVVVAFIALGALTFLGSCLRCLNRRGVLCVRSFVPAAGGLATWPSLLEHAVSPGVSPLAPFLFALVGAGWRYWVTFVAVASLRG